MFKRFLGKNSSEMTPESKTPQEPEQVVVAIQDGNQELRNPFITDYQPFVAKITSQICKRYIDPSRDDEFNIALAAFNEAIDGYSRDSGRSFLGFAETVVRRRLIDYFRKEERHAVNIPFSSFESEGDEETAGLHPLEIKQAVEAHETMQKAEERQSEILDFSRVLLEFEIRFADLVQASPKHADSRLMLMNVGRLLAGDADLMRYLISRKLLPVAELTSRAKLSRKTIERNRKYIIAVALIHNGPYPFLREYLHAGNSTEMSVSS
ncbi:RNA polymerase sigma-I factor [Gorillibacterium timonense]|uniref:RNA polymerase sigma-I factor n=1 Tax=Gorillibacterium timonense TaxID=1689269 RepID=UPI0009E90790|nr:RNA polymerase sigma-I factor [Gorillibacterium timonense]